MLTGKSQPVMKESLPEINSADKLYTLSAGTKVVDATSDSLGLVITTGFATAKGDLVLSILFPKPSMFKFRKDNGLSLDHTRYFYNRRWFNIFI